MIDHHAEDEEIEKATRLGVIQGTIRRTRKFQDKGVAAAQKRDARGMLRAQSGLASAKKMQHQTQAKLSQPNLGYKSDAIAHALVEVYKAGTSEGAKLGWDKRRRGSGPNKTATPADLEKARDEFSKHSAALNAVSRYDRYGTAKFGKDYKQEESPKEAAAGKRAVLAQHKMYHLHRQFEAENPGMVYDHGDGMPNGRKAGPRPMTDAERKQRGIKKPQLVANKKQPKKAAEEFDEATDRRYRLRVAAAVAQKRYNDGGGKGLIKSAADKMVDIISEVVKSGID